MTQLRSLAPALLKKHKKVDGLSSDLRLISLRRNKMKQRHSKSSGNVECGNMAIWRVATWQFEVQRLVAAFSSCFDCFCRLRKALTSQRIPKNHALHGSLVTLLTTLLMVVVFSTS